MKYLVIALLILPLCSFADVNFFETEINFWDEKKKDMRKESVSKKKDTKFEWSKYKNIENDEFFKEGNHIPPKPFMEVARRPTEENIKNWLDYIKMKNDVQARFLAALNSYKSKVNLPPESKQLIMQKTKNLPKPVILPSKKVTVTTYFLTTCPACKRMFKTLDELQKMGVYVEAIQVDSEKSLKFGVSVPIYKIRKKEREGLMSSGIGVPYSIVRVGSKAMPVSGFQTTRSLLQSLNNIK